MTRRSKTKIDTCYACDQLAVTREHIPPQVFFPTREEMGNSYPDFRVGLITVPSCEEHNSKKSLDDEYAFMIIAASFGVNDIALDYSKKISRAIAYRPAKAGVYLKKFHYASIGDLPTITPWVNLERFNSFLELLSRGLYFCHYGKKWKSQLQILPTSFFRDPKDKNAVDINRKIIQVRETAKDFFSFEEKNGNQPRIFYFQFHQDKEQNKHLLRMVFYEGFEAIVLEI